jgi:hypothetical protein
MFCYWSYHSNWPIKFRRTPVDTWRLRSHLTTKQGRQLKYFATLRRLCTTTAPVKKQFWAYVCSLRHPACDAHAPYYTAICDLSGSTIFFPNYLINGTIFEKKLLNMKRLFWYFLHLTFIWNISHSKKNSPRYDLKNVSSSSSTIPVIIVRC